jgi:hypothetical protein
VARSWSDIRPTLGNDATAAQPWIVDAVARGDFAPIEFVTIELREPNDHTRVFIDVAATALKLGSPDDFAYPSVTHRSAQAIADLLDLRLPTAVIVDRAARKADTWIEALIGPSPSTVDAMEAHTEALNEQTPPNAGLIAGVGKQWINSRRLENPGILPWGKNSAVNYGWETKEPAVPLPDEGPRVSVSEPTIRVWQTPGGKHNVDHVDRSQTLRLVRPTAWVEIHGIGTSVPIEVVAMSPVLSHSLSHTGPVLMRHPWLGQCSPLDEGGSCPEGVLPKPGDKPPGQPPPPGKPPPVVAARGKMLPAIATTGALAAAAALLARYSE